MANLRAHKCQKPPPAPSTIILLCVAQGPGKEDTNQADTPRA